MKYRIDGENYIIDVFFNCNSGTCADYTGTTPTGYDSLEEWAETEAYRLGAWKITGGNLVYDAEKGAEIEAQTTEENEQNRTVTAKELYDAIKVTNEVNEQEFTTEKTVNDNIVELTDCGDYTIPKFTLQKSAIWADLANKTWGELASSTWSNVGSPNTVDKVEIVTSTKNILPLEVTSQTVSGVEITQNANGTLTLDGTAAEAIELTLCGSINSKEMLFMLRDGKSYVASGLGSLEINLYYHDGTDRTLVDTTENGPISVNLLTKITWVTLSIPNGTALNEVTIAPQIELGTTATDYVRNKRSYMSVSATVDNGDILSYENGTVKLNKKVVGHCDGLRALPVFMSSIHANTYVKYFLPSVIETIKTRTIEADQINLNGFTTVFRSNDYVNTKFEILPNYDIGSILKVSNRLVADGENAPFNTVLEINSAGEIHMKAPLYIDAGAMDAINITDLEGTAIINSTGFHTI